jgi:hypothetical protein
MAKAVAAKTKQQFTEVAPNAAKTLSALREMGYDSFSSVLDLIDNSIDAEATKIAVTMKEAGKDIVIDIRDNGSGMDEKTLTEALRLGSDTEHDVKEDLGKFGMGLVTASISLAATCTSSPGRKGQRRRGHLRPGHHRPGEPLRHHVAPGAKSDKVLDLGRRPGYAREAVASTGSTTQRRSGSLAEPAGADRADVPPLHRRRAVTMYVNNRRRSRRSTRSCWGTN